MLLSGQFHGIIRAILYQPEVHLLLAIPFNGGISHYLKATNFNFNIPAGATIQGVTVAVNRSSTGTASPYIRDNSIRLIQQGNIVGSNRAQATDWPTTMGTATYGGLTDTWGTTGLSVSDINNSNFGVALSAINSSTATIYPLVAGTASSSEDNNTYTHNIALPSGIAAGDLLLIFWADRDRPVATVPIPAGWQELYRSVSGNGARRIAWYKIATGSEGTVLVLTSAGGDAIRSAHNSYRIAAGTFQGIPVAGTVATGSNNQFPDPPYLLPGFGNVKDTMDCCFTFSRCN